MRTVRHNCKQKKREPGILSKSVKSEARGRVEETKSNAKEALRAENALRSENALIEKSNILDDHSNNRKETEKSVSSHQKEKQAAGNKSYDQGQLAFVRLTESNESLTNEASILKEKVEICHVISVDMRDHIPTKQEKRIKTLEGSNIKLMQEVEIWQMKTKSAEQEMMNLSKGSQNEKEELKKDLKESWMAIKLHEKTEKSLVQEVNQWKLKTGIAQEEIKDLQLENEKKMTISKQEVEGSRYMLVALEKSNVSLIKEVNFSKQRIRSVQVEIVDLQKYSEKEVKALKLELEENRSRVATLEECNKVMKEGIYNWQERVKCSQEGKCLEVETFSKANIALKEELNQCKEQNQEALDSSGRSYRELSITRKSAEDYRLKMENLEKSNRFLTTELKEKNNIYARSEMELKASKRILEEIRLKSQKLENINRILAQEASKWEKRAKCVEVDSREFLGKSEENLKNTQNSLDKEFQVVEMLKNRNSTLSKEINHWKDLAMNFENNATRLRNKTKEDILKTRSDSVKSCTEITRLQKSIEELQEENEEMHKVNEQDIEDVKKSLEDSHLLVATLEKSNASLILKYEQYKKQVQSSNNETKDLVARYDTEMKSVNSDLQESRLRINALTTSNNFMTIEIANLKKQEEKTMLLHNCREQELKDVRKELSDDQLHADSNSLKIDALEKSNASLVDKHEQHKKQIQSSENTTCEIIEQYKKKLEHINLTLEESQSKINALTKSNNSKIAEITNFKKREEESILLHECREQQLREILNEFDDNQSHTEALSRSNISLMEDIDKWKNKVKEAENYFREFELHIQDQMKEAKKNMEEKKDQINALIASREDLVWELELLKNAAENLKEENRRLKTSTLKHGIIGSRWKLGIQQKSDDYTVTGTDEPEDRIPKIKTNIALPRCCMREDDAIQRTIVNGKLKMVVLQKSNVFLMRELSKWKEDVKRIKENADIDQRIADTIETMEEQIHKKDVHLRNLNEEMVRNMQRARKEKEEVEEEKCTFHAKCLRDVNRLESELENSQASHETYVATLMETLHKTRSIRNAETVRMTKEMDANIKQKDCDIYELNRIVESLKRLPSRHTPSQICDMSRLKGRMNHKSTESEKRSNEFQEICQRLEVVLKPENLRYIIMQAEHQRGCQGEKRVFSEFQCMVDCLNELYTLEEKSQKDFDQLILNRIDQHTNSHESDYVVDELNRKLFSAKAENQKLRNKLKVNAGLHDATSKRSGIPYAYPSQNSNAFGNCEC